MTDSKRAEVVRNIRSCIQSSGEGVNLSRFNTAYVSTNFSNVPYHELGFDNLKSLLFSMTDVVRMVQVNGETFVKLVEPRDEEPVAVVKRERSPSTLNNQSQDEDVAGVSSGHGQIATRLPPLVENNIIKLLKSTKDGIPTKLFNDMYHTRFGDAINHRHLGFHSLESLMRSLQCIVTLGSGQEASWAFLKGGKSFQSHSSRGSAQHGGARRRTPLRNRNRDRPHTRRDTGQDMINVKMSQARMWDEASLRKQADKQPACSHDMKVLGGTTLGMATATSVKKTSTSSLNAGEGEGMIDDAHRRRIEEQLQSAIQDNKWENWMSATAVRAPADLDKCRNEQPVESGNRPVESGNRPVESGNRPKRVEVPGCGELVDSSAEDDRKLSASRVDKCDSPVVGAEGVTSDISLGPNAFLMNRTQNTVEAARRTDMIPADAVTGPTQYARVPLPLVTQPFSLILSTVVSVGDFWIQRKGAEFYTALEDLMKALDFYHSRPAIKYKLPLTMVVPGQACVALCEEDKYWHRVVISEVRAFKVKVFYVDYGSYDEVDIHSLMFLRKDFMHLPAQAINCRLYRLAPLENDDGEWTLASREMFLDICTGEPCDLTGLITDIQNETISLLMERTTANDDWMSVNDKLSHDGVVRSVITSSEYEWIDEEEEAIKTACEENDENVVNTQSHITNNQPVSNTWHTAVDSKVVANTQYYASGKERSYTADTVADEYRNLSLNRPPDSIETRECLNSSVPLNFPCTSTSEYWTKTIDEGSCRKSQSRCNDRYCNSPENRSRNSPDNRSRNSSAPSDDGTLYAATTYQGPFETSRNEGQGRTLTTREPCGARGDGRDSPFSSRESNEVDTLPNTGKLPDPGIDDVDVNTNPYSVLHVDDLHKICDNLRKNKQKLVEEIHKSDETDETVMHKIRQLGSEITNIRLEIKCREKLDLAIDPASRESPHHHDEHSHIFKSMSQDASNPPHPAFRGGSPSDYARVDLPTNAHGGDFANSFFLNRKYTTPYSDALQHASSSLDDLHAPPVTLSNRSSRDFDHNPQYRSDQNINDPMMMYPYAREMLPDPSSYSPIENDLNTEQTVYNHALNYGTNIASQIVNTTPVPHNTSHMQEPNTIVPNVSDQYGNSLYSIAAPSAVYHTEYATYSASDTTATGENIQNPITVSNFYPERIHNNPQELGNTYNSSQNPVSIQFQKRTTHSVHSLSTDRLSNMSRGSSHSGSYTPPLLSDLESEPFSQCVDPVSRPNNDTTKCSICSPTPVSTSAICYYCQQQPTAASANIQGVPPNPSAANVTQSLPMDMRMFMPAPSSDMYGLAYMHGLCSQFYMSAAQINSLMNVGGMNSSGLTTQQCADLIAQMKQMAGQPPNND